jgi:transcriptional regulator with XRE-family HTH domain
LARHGEYRRGHHVGKRLAQLTFQKPLDASEFVEDLWRGFLEAGLSLDALAAKSGVSRNTLKRAMQGRLPRKQTYNKLQNVLGVLPAPLKFADDLWREQAGKMRLRSPNLPRLRKLSAAARKGKKRPASVGRAISQAKLASPHREAQAERLRTMARSATGLAQRSLGGQLRHNPRPSAADKTEMQRMARVTSGLHGPEADSALKLVLKRRGLDRGGRPLDEERCQLIRAELAKVIPTPSGKLPKGFWPRTEDLVRRETAVPFEPGSLFRWWTQHRRACPEQAANNNYIKPASVQRPFDREVFVLAPRRSTTLGLPQHGD